MDKARRGTATAFGLFDAIYQLIVAFVLILFCTDKGGIAYGAAFAVCALACGTLTIFARWKSWAKKALLILGQAQIIAIFALAFVLAMVLPEGKNVASEGILMLRSIAFYSGATLLIGAIMFYPTPEYKRSQVVLVSAAYKAASLIGIFLYFIIPALVFWKATGKTAFNEWLLGFGGEAPDFALLVDQFEMWTAKWKPILQGIGMLLISVLPTYLWYLDAGDMFFEKKSQMKSYILTAAALPFLAVAEYSMISGFLATKKIAYIIFAVVILAVYAGLWVLCYILPKMLGWDRIVYVDEDEIAEAPADQAPVKGNPAEDGAAHKAVTAVGAPADGDNAQ